MRVLVLHPGPDFSVHDVFTGWMEALRDLLGPGNVAPFNMNDRLVAFSNALRDTHQYDETGHPIVTNMFSEEGVFYAAMEGLSHAMLTFWPDIVLCVSGFFLNAGTMQLMRMRRFKVVMLCTESPYQDSEQMDRAQLSDLVLLNDPTNLDMFRGVTRAEYMPHAYRPVLHRPRTGPPDANLACDLAFIGTAFKSRIEFFEQMDLDGLDVLIAGGDWGNVPQDSPVAKFVATGPTGPGGPDCVDNTQAVQVYQNAKCGINFYRREARPEENWDGAGWAMGPREVEMAAVQLPFIRDPRPEGDTVFSMLPIFGDPKDASDKLRWMLAHDAKREEAARQARSAIADRTFEANAKRFLTLAEKL